MLSQCCSIESPSIESDSLESPPTSINHLFLSYFLCSLSYFIHFLICYLFTASFMILYTDYNHSLIYFCSDMLMANSRCRDSSKKSVEIWTRHKVPVPQTVRAHIHSVMENELCVKSEDLTRMTIGKYAFILLHGSFKYKKRLQIDSAVWQMRTSWLKNSYQWSLAISDNVKFEIWSHNYTKIR